MRMVLLKSSSPPSLIRHALNKKLRTELGTDLVDVGKKIKYGVRQNIERQKREATINR